MSQTGYKKGAGCRICKVCRKRYSRTYFDKHKCVSKELSSHTNCEPDTVVSKAKTINHTTDTENATEWKIMPYKKPTKSHREIGDSYRPLATVSKMKNGVESVLIIRGLRYVLEHPNQYKQGKK